MINPIDYSVSSCGTPQSFLLIFIIVIILHLNNWCPQCVCSIGWLFLSIGDQNSGLIIIFLFFSLWFCAVLKWLYYQADSSMADLSWPRLYNCYKCQNHVCCHDDIVSKSFQVNSIAIDFSTWTLLWSVVHAHAPFWRLTLAFFFSIYKHCI